MITELSNFAARLREAISSEGRVIRAPDLKIQNGDSCNSPLREDATFGKFALELFALQFKSNAAYQKVCKAGGLTPEVVEHWTRIPAVPATSFKELDLTCLAPDERTAVFHSSGTTEQKPSRHYHSAESLAVYEVSLWKWFEQSVFANSKLKIQNSKLICLTPPPAQAPYSSLVHMSETIRQKLGGAESGFVGELTADGAWALDFEAALAALNSSLVTRHSSLLLGTAFSFVHLLDFLEEKNLRFDLPAGSRVMETGGYKNHSRTMPKDELHTLITERLGIPQSHIFCEYGMSELSSQAYDRTIQVDDLSLPHPGPLPKERGNGSQPTGESGMFRNSKGRTLLFPLPEGEGQGEGKRAVKTHCFQFSPWARVQIISPETNREVTDGETGLIRVFDLANVFSVMAIQTEDLGVRRGDGFELLGRARFTEPRGCSLMSIGSK